MRLRMISLSYSMYLRSPEWRTLCHQAQERDRGYCQVCRRRSRRMHVHHLSYRHIFEERLDELQLVCLACHKRIHGLEMTDELPKPKRRRQRPKPRVPRPRAKRITSQTDRQARWRALMSD